jgi:hypothetical protein
MPKNQYRGLKPNPQNLGVEVLPEGIRATKAMRFTLPDELADQLETMSKMERDELMKKALIRKYTPKCKRGISYEHPTAPQPE